MKRISYPPRSAPGLAPAAVVARTMCVASSADDSVMDPQIPGSTSALKTA